MQKKFFSLRPQSPHWIFLYYYSIAIFVGAAFLSLPLASKTGKAVPFLDAFFTATSALCVTGLNVIDVGSTLSIWGQSMVLLLIQIGGLGITTFSVYLFFYLRSGVGIRGRWMLQETLLHTPLNSLRDLVQKIFLMTLVVETVGAALLSCAFVPEKGWAEGIYYGIFHSVSAFCNAGFSLFSNSLEGYRLNPLVNITLMSLIVLGGIGFLVMAECLGFSKKKKLSLHTRLVLWTSGILIVGGALFIGGMEWSSAFGDMGPLEKVGAALFQSVSTRTAGFSSLDLRTLGIPTLFFIMGLMFVGASPGSCGGGIKTTSLALFAAVAYSRSRGNPHTSILKRTIPGKLVTKATVMVLLAMFLAGVAILALLLVQQPEATATKGSEAFLVYAFEAVSALATVGLSLGATAKLVPAGKLIVIILMFIGRVGLLTVAFSLIRQARSETTVHYSEENIMIG